MHTQAWRLRRCISEFNGICRRPHWPREAQIRSLLKSLDIELPERKEAYEEESEEEASVCDEENIESEGETEDLEVEAGETEDLEVEAEAVPCVLT